MGRAFAREKGLEEFEEEFAKGAQLAQDPLAFESVAMLGDSDREILREEVVRLAARSASSRHLSLLRQAHRWRHPWQLYSLVVCCSMAAAVQGMVRLLLLTLSRLFSLSTASVRSLTAS
jgi:hypothetical protein